MLTAALALSTVIALGAPAFAADDAPKTELLKAEGLPVRVELKAPQRGEKGWEYVINKSEEQVITIRRPFHTPPIIGIGAEEIFQPDFAHTDDAVMRALVTDTVPGTKVPEDATVERTHHDTLGDLVTITWTEPGSEGAASLDRRVVVFPVDAGFAWYSGTDIAGRDQLVAGMDEILASSKVPRPAVAADQFQTGHFVAPAGYELDLPEGWRVLTESEMGLLSNRKIPDGVYKGKPVHEVFVNPVLTQADLNDAPAFSCSATYAEVHPLELLPPERSEVIANNYIARAHVFMRKGTYTDSTGERISMDRVDVTGGIPVVIDKEERGALDYIQIGDREAYWWTAPGTYTERPVKVSTFYTTYDNIGLDCGAFAQEGDDTTLGLFRTSMDSLRVTDGGAHPMYLSAMSKYKRWWPWTHPALQLYWLPIPLFLVGIGLAMRGD